MLVANGHGLIAVIRPSKKADNQGAELLSIRELSNSSIFKKLLAGKGPVCNASLPVLELKKFIYFFLNYLLEFIWIATGIHKTIGSDVDFLIATNN